MSQALRPGSDRLAVLAAAGAQLEPPAERLLAAVAALTAEAGRTGSPGLLNDAERIARAGVKLKAELARCFALLPAALQGDVPIGSLRHDLRTPLNAIKGYTELLMEDADDGTTLPAERMRRVIGDVEAMDQAIDRVLMKSAEPADTALAPEAELPGEPAAGGLRVLVVDDDHANRDVLDRRLAREGYAVVQAADGAAALALLEAERFDLVLLDVTMPGLGGVEVLHRIRADRAKAHLAVIMISAGDEVARIAECLECGADDYVVKPFDPTLLRARVGACLERKLLRERQEASWRQRFNTLLDMVVDGVLVIDDDGVIETANPTAATIFGLELGSLPGRRLSELLVVAADWRPAHWSGRAAGSAIREIQARRLGVSDSALFPVECSAKEVTIDDRRGFAVVVRDISVRKATEERNAYLAHFDQITELPNRTAMIDRLESALADNRLEGMLMFIAFANYRELNDSLRKDALHDLLRGIARRLKPTCDATDRMAYLGNGEFAVLSFGAIDEAAARRRAGTLVAELQRPFLLLGGHEIEVEVHVGATLFPSHGHTAVRLLRNADLALGRARLDRSQPVGIFDESLSVAQMKRRQTERELRAGLAAGQFELRYQPKLALTTRRLAGAEALVRWRHPLRGQVSPAEFIPIAESSGQILPLGEWIIRAAAAEVARWTSLGLDGIHVAVNISGNQFRHQNLVQILNEACAEAAIAPERLEFEVTESVLMDDIAQAKRTLAALRDGGVSLAIDDFGTGYSSLSVLHELPFDILKIDQSFVRRLRHDASARAITRTIIALAHNLRLGTVAEGIEAAEEAAFLVEHGCTLAQGYLYAKPLTADEFVAFAQGSLATVA